MTTSKVNPNITTNLNPYQHDTQQRIISSKRTTKNNFDQTIDDNNTTVLHQSKIHHSSRLSKSKYNCEIPNISSSKPESGSEEVYTAPLNNEGIKTQKQRTRQSMGDYIVEDADEESTAIRTIMTKSKTPVECIHRLSIPSNNSAIRLQQQGTGDHYHTNTKQHKSRSKTTGKYHRLIEQQDLDEANTYRWHLIMYILIILILAFVIYRFLIAIWPKPKKTLIEQLIDNLSNFFTP